MSTDAELDLSGAAAHKLTMEGLKNQFQRKRNLEASFRGCTVEMEVPLSYQSEFIEYIVRLTGYTIAWGGASRKMTICW